jgi:hypothetical protein
LEADFDVDNEGKEEEEIPEDPPVPEFGSDMNPEPEDVDANHVPFTNGVGPSRIPGQELFQWADELYATEEGEAMPEYVQFLAERVEAAHLRHVRRVRAFC